MSSNLKAAIAAKEALSAYRSKEPDAKYHALNNEAKRTYDRLTFTERVRFHASGV